MEADKINNASFIVNKVIEIFKTKIENVKLTNNDNFFDIQLTYKNILIHIYSSKDRFYGIYRDVEIKYISNEYFYDWTAINSLISYNNNQSYCMNGNLNYLVECILLLKEYIDNKLIFFEYHNKDFSKRYFFINGKTIELPLIMNLDEDIKLKFGNDSDKLIKNKSYFL